MGVFSISTGARISVDAAIIAGAPDKEDPLLAGTGLHNKALLPLAGQPMIAHVVKALDQSGYVSRIVIVGLGPEDGLNFERPVEYVPTTRGGLLDNVLAGLEAVAAGNPSAERALVSACDIPLLTPEAVRWFIESCLETDHDLYYPIVEQQVMETQYPGSARTFVPLREGRFAGGDLYMVRIPIPQVNQELVRNLLGERKNYWRQARLIGLWPLIKLALGWLSLAEAERIASRAIGLRGRAVVSPHASLGMDVDKPHQLAIARAILERG